MTYNIYITQLGNINMRLIALSLPKIVHPSCEIFENSKAGVIILKHKSYGSFDCTKCNLKENFINYTSNC